jgi:hypothetical protein
VTVRQPSGADAEVWGKYLRGKRNVFVALTEIQSTLWTDYPGSVYTSLLIPPHDTHSATAAILALQTQLARNPPMGAANGAKLELAYEHFQVMNEAIIKRGNVQEAHVHAEAAKALLDELLGRETEAEVAKNADDMLGSYKTAEDLQAWLDERRNLSPNRECEQALIGASYTEIGQLVAAPDTTDKERAKLKTVHDRIEAYGLAAFQKKPADMSTALSELHVAAVELESARHLQLVDPALAAKWLAALSAAAELSARHAVDAACKDVGVKKSLLDVALKSLPAARLWRRRTTLTPSNASATRFRKLKQHRRRVQRCVRRGSGMSWKGQVATRPDLIEACEQLRDRVQICRRLRGIRDGVERLSAGIR